MHTPSPASAPWPTHITAIMNPAKPRYETARRLLLAEIAARGWPAPTVLTTTRERAGESQARQALAAGSDLVLIAGGDGTIREAARALIGSGVRIGVVPLGTANIFSRNIGLSPRNLRRSIRIALDGAPCGFDVGMVRMRLGSQEGVELWMDATPFLVVAGLGHDAATVGTTNPTLKRRIGWLAYFASGARYLLRRPVGIRVTIDGGPPQDITAWTVLVGNCGRIPGGIRVLPQAQPDDGLLDVGEVTVARPWQWLPLAVAGVIGNASARTHLVTAQARAVELVPSVPLRLQLDGDVFANIGAVRIRVEPGALLVHVDPLRSGRRKAKS